MAENNRSGKSSSPIKAWMKVAAGSAKSAFTEYMKDSVMPTTSAMLSDIKEIHRETVDKHKVDKPKKQSEIFRKIMDTPTAKNAKKLVSDGWKEVKRGNIFMIGANGMDDEPDLDFDADSGSTMFNDGGSANAEMMSGYDEIGDRISDQTEATYKAAEASMNATVMSSSAIIESQEKMGTAIISRLDSINQSMESISKTQTDMMEKFFKAVTTSLDRLGVSSEETVAAQLATQEEIFKTGKTGNAAGLNLKAYKTRIINNAKRMLSEGGSGDAGAIAQVVKTVVEGGGVEGAMSVVTGLMFDAALSNNIGKLGAKIESVVADGIPRVIMGLTDMGNDPNANKFAKTIGKLLGIDLTANTGRPDVKYEGKAIPFDDQTKAAIVNVIPKHLSEISEYTKVLVKKIANLDDEGIDKISAKAKTFDMLDGQYKSREDLTKEVFDNYYNRFFYDLRNSELGKGLQAVADKRKGYINDDNEAGKNARQEIQDSYDSIMKQIAMYMYTKNNESVNLSDANRLEELGNVFAKNGASSDQIQQLLNEVKLIASKASVVDDMANLRYNLYRTGTDARNVIDRNANLVDTFLTDPRYKNMDMAEIMPYLIGKGPNIYNAAGFRNRATNTNQQTQNRPDTAPIGGFNPAESRNDRGERGSQSDQSAADSSHSAGGDGNANTGNQNDSRASLEDRNNRLRFNRIQQSEESAVNELLGTQGRFADTGSRRNDRMREAFNRFGESGSGVLSKITTKVAASGSEAANAILRGDTNKVLEVIFGAVAGTALAAGQFVGKTVLSPAMRFVFGKKNEKGYREDGMLSGVSNKIHDMMQSVAARIDGKDWTDANGTVHRADDPNESIFNKAKATLNKVTNSFKKVFVGDDENRPRDPNAESVVDSIQEASKDLFSSAKRNFEQLIFGNDYADLDEEGKKARIAKVKEDVKKRAQDGIKGSLIGGGVSAALGTTALPALLTKVTAGGLLGSGVLATVVLNPMVGAGIGFTVGFLKRSESFQRFFFGGEYTDKNGETQWREGIVSRKMQDFFKKNKTTIGVSGAIGAGAAVLSGAKLGMLGTLLGGPLAGASIGITTALVGKSNAFHTFLFGDEEKGITGITQQWSKLTEGMFKNGSGVTAAGLKTLGFGGTGALIGKFAGGAAIKAGLLPSLFGVTSPTGLALLGMTGGVILAHKNLNRLLFGKDEVDENGEVERKEGIIGKFTNALKVTLLQPVANVSKSVVRSLTYQINHNVLAPLRVAFYPLANFSKKLMTAITKKFTSFGNKIGKGIDKYLLDPMRMLVKAVTKPLARAVGVIGQGIKLGVGLAANTFAKGVGLTAKLASLAMTPEEKAEWEKQKAIAKEQKATDRAKLNRENKEDKLANKDRKTILKYTNGDYGDDTSEARRIAEKRAGHKIVWKNKTPHDGWYTGQGSDQKNDFKQATTILGTIRNKVGDVLTWLERHAIRRDTTTGHAAGIDKVPEGQSYEANEKATLGQREVVQIPKPNGKGSTIVEGGVGSFFVHNGGGEKVYNGSTEQPIPVLVSAYTQTALDQRNGLDVKIASIEDEAKEDATEAIDESEVGVKSSIPEKIKDYSILFGKSIFGPDWEPKKGGLFDIATDVLGNTIGATLAPIIGAAKTLVGIAKGAYKVMKLGWEIVKLPFKLGKWAGTKIFNGAKRGLNFVKNRIQRHAENGKIDLKATIGSMANHVGAKISSTADTVKGNRKYAKIRKLILSGNSFYKDKFNIYTDEDGREHIIAKEDVEFDDGTIVKKDQELKDAFGAGNLLKRTESNILKRAANRLRNKGKSSDNEETTNLDSTSTAITSSLAPTNNILEDILGEVKDINGTEGKSEDGEDHNPITDLYDKLNGSDGSAKTVRNEKEKENKENNAELRESENNSALKQLADNSEDEKETRQSWFGKHGKLVKILGIAALAAFGIYKFIAGGGIKGLVTNLANAFIGGGKQLFSDIGFGISNLTDQQDLATNISNLNTTKIAATSLGGVNINLRKLAFGLDTIIKTRQGGLKAGAKAILEEGVGNTVDTIVNLKNPFKSPKHSPLNGLSKTVETSLTKHLEKASTNLTSFAAKAEESGTKTVAEAFTNFVTGVVKKAGGEAAETAAENATKSGVFKELLEAVKLKAAKIMARVSGSKFAKGVVAVISFGLSEAGFAVLGGLNGASGAAKLFHVDNEDVDPLMIGISAAMGAFTSTIIGSIMDSAAAIVAEATGLDLLSEVASFIYRLLGDDTKLDTAREKFRAGYEEYKDTELHKQYETYMTANANTVSPDYSYEDFLSDVQSGAKGAKLDSEITYNKKKNKSFFDKVGDKAIGIAKGAKSITKDIGTGLFGDTEIVYVDNENEVIYRQQGEQWFAYKWTGKVLVSVGLVNEDNIPSSAISVKCHVNNWFESGTDEVNTLPKRYGWGAWKPGTVTDGNGNIITNEVDVESSDGSKETTENATVYDMNGPTAKMEDSTDVPYYLDDSDTKFEDMSDPSNNGTASYATIMRDKKISEVLGKSFADEIVAGKTADEIAEDAPSYNINETGDEAYDGIDVTTAMNASASMESNDEFREYLKDYALWIRDEWTDSTKYNAGFFIVHPTENSFIRYTAAGQLFGTGYSWTGVLSLWITGNLISRKITNYNELIKALDEEGVEVATIDPNDIVDGNGNDEDEDSGSIFDILGKAFNSIFKAFNTSWKRLMTGEEVDEVMEKTESKWVDRVAGKKIVRPISNDGAKPTSSNFKAASFLMYILDSSKNYFREYNIFNCYTGVDVPVEVVQNWVKSSEAWIVSGDAGNVSYDENGMPNVEPIDPNGMITTWQVTQTADGLSTIVREADDGEYSKEDRVKIADDAKKDFDGYKDISGITDAIPTNFIDDILKTRDRLLTNPNPTTPKQTSSNNVTAAFIQGKEALAEEEKPRSSTNVMSNFIGSRGGFGFSNKHSEDLDSRYENIKTATMVSTADARSMSKYINAEDAANTEAVNILSSKDRVEEVRKQFSNMIDPTEVLMGMDGTYWVWDRTNTFHKYTYFGQDLMDELTNDEMMALFKSGRYLVKTKPSSYLDRMELTLNSNLSILSNNYNIGVSSVGSSLSYASNYISGESAGSNIVTTGGTSVVNTSTGGTTTTTSSSSSSIWDKIRDAASDAANTISNLVGEKTKSNTSSGKSNNSKNKKRASKGGFGDKLNGVPYYSQNDSRWKNADYSTANDNATMGDAGCGPTVLSMVDNYFGGHQSPTDYARLAQDTGYRDDSGTNWDFISGATKAMGLNTNQIENPNSVDIADQLSSGQPVILSGVRTQSPNDSPYTKAGHYVVATGMNPNGTVNISDPRGKNYSKAFSLDKLASDTGSMWGFAGKGGYGKLKKELIKHLNKKKKTKGGGRGRLTADEARKVVVDWISCLYGQVDYDNLYSPRAVNMDAAVRGTGRGITDCSGMQEWIYNTALGIEIGGNTGSQSSNSFPVIDRSNGDLHAIPNFSALKPGDLVYLCKTDGSTMAHVEMYIGGIYGLGIGSRTVSGSRIIDLNGYLTNGGAASHEQKYWGTKRIIQDGQTYDANIPDPSWLKFDANTYSATNGGSSSSSTSSIASSSTSTTVSKSAKTKNFFDVFSSLMGEVGNRYATGVATGNFDTDFTAAFNEILNGGSTISINGPGSSSSLGNYTSTGSGTYANGGIYNGDYIGAYVKKYESGANGSKSVGNCGNDWGRSWGSYSFTERWGTAIRFLRQYYPDLAAKLYAADSGDARYKNPSHSWQAGFANILSPPDDVSAVWNAALAKDGDAKFFANEHQFAADNFYKPALDGTIATTSFNADTHSRSAQELLWSWAICEGGPNVGSTQFKKTGITSNNVTVPDLLERAFQVRRANTKTYDVGTRYTNTGNPGDSEYTQLLNISGQAPFSMPSVKSSSSTKTDKSSSKDKSYAKGGYGDNTSNIKNNINNLLNKKDNTVHVSNEKAKAVNLRNLAELEAKINAYEPIVGDNDKTTSISYDNSIPGSNGLKQNDVKSSKGGYGVHRYQAGGRGDINTSSTTEKALTKLVDLVEAIVSYVSQSNDKLECLKDIKNQQVVVKGGDKNIAIASPNGGNTDISNSTNSKSIGRLLAEILASG